ncbi:MAG: DJ-1 family glyoxalase III [Lachnospiraceae bacterium]
MSKTVVFFAEGCEEIEGLTVVDVLRRAKEEVLAVSVTGKKEVAGSHKITFQTDALFEDVNFDEIDGVVLPGGIPGTPNLQAHAGVNEVIKKFAEEGKLVSAICAAPGVLGHAGVLQGKKATCHPGHEEHLLGAECLTDSVVRDGNIITSRGMGTAIAFALEIVDYYDGADTVEKVRKGLVY